MSCPHGNPIGDCDICDEIDAAFEAGRQSALAEQPAQAQEPAAWLFQHEETGLTECVDAQQVEWGFEKNNPRWQKVAPLYTTPPAPAQPLTEQFVLEIAREVEWSDRNAINNEELVEFASKLQARVQEPLTDEQIQKLRHNIDWTASWSYINFARAIEAAHGITKGGE
jgi:hypothetical protein